MRQNRWKTACAKLKVAKREICGYDTSVSGGGHRRSQNTGEIKCERISLFSHWGYLCSRDAQRLVNQLGLVLASVPQEQRWLVVIQLRVLLLVVSQGMRAIQATFVTNTRSSAPTRSSENFKGMLPMCCVPFCLPKA